MGAKNSSNQPEHAPKGKTEKHPVPSKEQHVPVQDARSLGCVMHKKPEFRQPDIETNVVSSAAYEPAAARYQSTQENSALRNMIELLVSGYLRHVVFALFSDAERKHSVLGMIPWDVVKLCEQFYEANMIVFMIQHSFDQSTLNGVKCINLNCKKVVEFRTVAMDDTERVTTLDQHW